MSKLIKKAEGYWFYPVNDFVYDEAYFNKYKEYVDTIVGKMILNSRLKLVEDYNNVLDIGIGCGTFINNKKWSKGFDVNPVAIKTLKDTERWCDPYTESFDKFDAVTFFDSFEHIEKPEKLLKNITSQTVIIVIPLFKDLEDILVSKHYRPDEHFHYFTLTGFLDYMINLGFHNIDFNDNESQLGREQIFTLVFKRK